MFLACLISILAFAIFLNGYPGVGMFTAVVAALVLAYKEL